ncbi:MAG: DUF4981 domain-containing protein [Sphingobacteriales bacterium]|nr:DUF4981 domain-containing protein [Sphingobacteriales bacterium]
MQAWSQRQPETSPADRRSATNSPGRLAGMPRVAAADRTMNDWENPLLPSEGSVEAHAHFIPYPESSEALQYLKAFGEEGQLSTSVLAPSALAGPFKSPAVLSLDGTWKFHLAPNASSRPKDFYLDSSNLSSWTTIHVPANWQVEGFDKFIFTDVEYPIPPNPPFVPADYNPVGSYKRSFTLPAPWRNKKIYIHLGAVNSFFYLWINGKYAGFSKDSKTPAEFDITGLVHPGENTVSVQVFRFSDGTYLEGQDMWKLSGIERDVYLIARPGLFVRDYFVRAGLDADYRDGLLDLDVELDHLPALQERGGSVRVSLLDNPDVPLCRQTGRIGEGSHLHFQTKIPQVRKWNAEHPELYTLLIEQLDRRGRTVEAVAQQIGFRTIEVRHGLLLVNGVAVKIKGVNRHEHDMNTGKVITEAGMLQDIRLFKQYNINAMRCSHYPNREEWYALCDKYGIYVIDEANIECDGMSMLPSVNTLSDKNDWKDAYMDRTRRMWQRDKNHCSIISWSLGNESRWGDNFAATYTYLKSKDPTRIVQYEEARDNPYTDIICPMYKTLQTMQDFVKEWRTRPMIQVEYAHMMGNSGGNLKDDWDIIYKHPQLQGGFIWDFCDQTFRRQDSHGRWIWAYGRDMGQVGATSDTSFCADGMFAADRTPHPQAFEMKKVYQYANFEPVAFTRDRIRITNRYDFTNLKQFAFRWYMKCEGQRVAGGELPEISLAPHAATELSLLGLEKFMTEKAQASKEYFLYIEMLSTGRDPLIPAGEVLAWEQWALPVQGGGEKTMRAPMEKPLQAGKDTTRLEQREDTKYLTLYDAGFEAVFNRQTGWLEQLNVEGKPMLKAPLQPDFTRSATDNDIGNSQQIRCAIWAQAMEGARLDSFVVASADADGAIVSVRYTLPAVHALYSMTYHVGAGGTIRIDAAMKAGPEFQPELPRFGLAFILQPVYDNVRWFGRGPFDNYQDRNYAAAIDVYALKADSFFHPYARAQESGYRTDVRWMSMTDGNGRGLMARALSGSSGSGAVPTFSVGVLHFDRQRMEFDRNAPENVHGGSMSNDDLIRWNIDYKQEGVGGDNAWGAQTHSEYVLPYTDYTYSFLLQVIK